MFVTVQPPGLPETRSQSTAISAAARPVSRSSASALSRLMARIAFAREMTFQYYTVTESLFADHPRVEVQADGVITKNTPQQFSQFLANHDVPAGSDVYFMSGGGNLEAGLKLGRLIREHGMNTVVGAHTPISDETLSFLQHHGAITLVNLPFHAPILTASFRFSSYCISACTFAFLGGVYRYIGLGSIYAVHKFKVDCGAAENENLKVCLIRRYPCRNHRS